MNGFPDTTQYGLYGLSRTKVIRGFLKHLKFFQYILIHRS